jgi:hypothetical protein
MTEPKDNLEIEFWARGLRRRWWRSAFAPLRDLLSTGAHDLLHRLHAGGDRIWLRLKMDRNPGRLR